MNLTAAILGMFGCIIVGAIIGAVAVRKGGEEKTDVEEEVLDVWINSARTGGEHLGEMTVRQIVTAWADCRDTKRSALSVLKAKERELSLAKAQLEACGEVVEDLKQQLKIAKRPRTGRVVDDLME